MKEITTYGGVRTQTRLRLAYDVFDKIFDDDSSIVNWLDSITN